MRILFTHHFPLEQPPSGPLLQRWAHALSAQGHEVHLLIVTDRATDAVLPGVGRVVCRRGDPAAELSFDLPCFGDAGAGNQPFTFAVLTDRQLADYRDTLRRQLDAEIERFDPNVIHAQHVWLYGQLALETGVPYVLNAWGPELHEYAADARVRQLVDQAAENAGWILVPDEFVALQLESVFEGSGERILRMPRELILAEDASPAAQLAASNQLLSLYQRVLDERFGNFR
jgi:hypothetical protein